MISSNSVSVINTYAKKLIAGLTLLLMLMIISPKAFCGKVYIPKDTEIPVGYKTDLSSKLENPPAADDIFEISSDQAISGVKYLKQGGKVYCQITKFKKPGLLGSGGEIEIRIDSVQTTLGKNIKVENIILQARGKNKKLKAILMLPLLGYGLLVKGEDAQLGRQGETVILSTPELISISY